jgi:hypothetical protein
MLLRACPPIAQRIFVPACTNLAKIQCFCDFRQKCAQGLTVAPSFSHRFFTNQPLPQYGVSLKSKKDRFPLAQPDPQRRHLMDRNLLSLFDSVPHFVCPVPRNTGFAPELLSVLAEFGA